MIEVTTTLILVDKNDNAICINVEKQDNKSLAQSAFDIFQQSSASLALLLCDSFLGKEVIDVWRR